MLREYGVRGSLLRAIQSLYSQSESCVRVLGSKSDPFPVRVGLRQGCALSPILFVIFMDRISRRSRVEGGLQFGGLRIAPLLFADDVVLMASWNGAVLQSLYRCDGSLSTGPFSFLPSPMVMKDGS